MSEVQASLLNLRGKIKAAFDNVNARLAEMDSGKLDAANNFDPQASGLSSLTLADAVLEIKVLIDNLNATYATDSESAAMIQQVNAAWAAADENLSDLIAGRLPIDGTAADSSKLGGVAASEYITVSDTIDCGTL